MGRFVKKSKGENFFTTQPPIYVNRVMVNYSVAEHTHDFYEITYVCQGKGVHYINEEAHTVEKGDVYLLPLHCPHLFRPLSANAAVPMIVMNVLFPADYFSSAQTEKFAEALQLPIEGADMEPWLPAHSEQWKKMRDEDGSLLRVILGMHEEYKQRQTLWQSSIAAGLILLLALLVRGVELKEKKERMDPVAAQALQWISELCTTELTIGEVANRIGGFGERQLQRRLLRAFGKTFRELLIEHRISRCCELLSERRLQVKEAALQSGFMDLPHFHSKFKEMIGMTPGQYKRLHTNI